jgi:hypothetical protein
MRYKLLGFVVWRGGWWFLRRRYRTHFKVAAGVVVVAGVARLAARGRGA